MNGNEWKNGPPSYERDKERSPLWYMDKISIWCYACGMIWFNCKATELYDKYSRCPICNGDTDGVKE